MWAVRNLIFLARAMQHLCLHPPGYGGVQGAAAMPQARCLARKEDLSHTMAWWGEGQLILQPTEEPGVTLSTPELPRAEFSMWSRNGNLQLLKPYRKFQYCVLRFAHTLGYIATRWPTANAQGEAECLWSKMHCNHVSRAPRWPHSTSNTEASCKGLLKTGTQKNWDCILSGKTSGLWYHFFCMAFHYIPILSTHKNKYISTLMLFHSTAFCHSTSQHTCTMLPSLKNLGYNTENENYSQEVDVQNGRQVKSMKITDNARRQVIFSAR